MFLNRVAITVLAGLLVVVIITAIMTFAGIGPESYMPYVYFAVALVVLSVVLPMQPQGMILADS